MLLFILIACGLDTMSAPALTDSAIDDTGDTGVEDTGVEDTGVEDTEDTEDTQPPGQPGDSRANPRAPRAGELILNELMLNPAAVQDSSGEWVELLNTSDDWLDLTGGRLADLDVDDSAITAASDGSLVVAPRGFLVICASLSDNGGVDCQGSVESKSSGGGFVLANSSDEVVLRAADGSTLDQLSYGSGFSVTGGSLGLDPGAQSAAANDDLDSWCAQSGALAGGDWGNPGQPNDDC